jgi:hypothetical protein
MRLAGVLIKLGDSDSTKLELTAARRAFERLGAAPEARRALRLGEDTPVTNTLSTEAMALRADLRAARRDLYAAARA